MPKEKIGTKTSKSDIKDIKQKTKQTKKPKEKTLCKQMYLVKKLFCKMHWKSYFVL